MVVVAVVGPVAAGPGPLQDLGPGPGDRAGPLPGDVAARNGDDGAVAGAPLRPRGDGDAARESRTRIPAAAAARLDPAARVDPAARDAARDARIPAAAARVDLGR